MRGMGLRKKPIEKKTKNFYNHKFHIYCTLCSVNLFLTQLENLFSSAVQNLKGGLSVADSQTKYVAITTLSLFARVAYFILFLKLEDFDMQWNLIC